MSVSILSARPLRRALAIALLLSSVGLASAKSVPGDGALPVVELMPLTVQHEAALQLSAEQAGQLDAYRKQAMPGRIALQKKILALRGQLRMAILEDEPAATRQALMQQIADAEVEHFRLRDRCVEFVRKTLQPEQMAQLKSLYLAGLR
jgi:LTXXQ motif family protein